MLSFFGLFGLNVAMNSKMFSFDRFLGFVSLFVVLKEASEILVLIVNTGKGILVNLIVSFPNSLTCRHYFLQ